MKAAEVIILMGVSGAGKTTVGSALAARLGWPFYDADDLHPPENVAKMRAGIPLSDEDRWLWLAALGALIREHTASSQPAVLACSALKRAYRDRLMGEGVRVVYLKGSAETFRRRLEQRRGHYMPAGLLGSQLAALEEPEDALVVNAALEVNVIVSLIRHGLGL